MNINLKKVLIILVVVLILGLISLLAYNFFVKEELIDGGGGTGQLPQGEDGEPVDDEFDIADIIPNPELKVRPLSIERILAPTLSADQTKVIYYSQETGNVWQSSFEGSSLTKVSGSNLENLVQIIWSPNKDKVISVYQDTSGNITKFFFDYKTGNLVSLNSPIQEISWSPNGTKIAYQYTNQFTDENNISTANPDGTGWRNIFSTRLKDLNINWIATGISFSEKPSGIAQSSLFLLNTINGALTKTLSDIHGMASLWSPKGDKVLYSRTNQTGKNIELFTALKNGTNKNSLGISTLVEKCVWSEDNRNIFCAIPVDIEKADMLPDDFYKGIFTSDDEFWKINTETGERINLLESWEREEELEYDATSLFLSPTENYLFFVNKKNGVLYSIEL